ncbi:MAG: DivIVA domain-containing protein [Ruminococcus sp.]|nr:DivIVA domain-containing protein [Ruminococcus sp.]
MSLSRSKIEGYMLPTIKRKYYDKEQVDAFLQEIASDADDTLCELSEKRERIRELEKREESIAQALVIVKQLSEQIISKAKAEAEKSIMETTAKQMEIEEEISRLEAVRDKMRSDLEENIKTLMNKFLQDVKDAGTSAE